MNYDTTKTMAGNNNWQGRRATIDDSCQSEGCKLALRKLQTDKRQLRIRQIPPSGPAALLRRGGVNGIL